jgi:hypothetical protein
MGETYDGIAPGLADWLRAQHIFFVATAPSDGEAHVNCSPKGMDTFRLLGPREVAYLDVTGSGVETIAHVRDNGRIVLMFCAFHGSPKIVRLHGRAEVLPAGHPEYELLQPLFPAYPGRRSIIRVQVTRISDSCGYAVPRFEYVGERDTLIRWSEKKGETGLEQYRQEKNARSIDGLAGL